MADITIKLKNRKIELSWEEFQELIDKFQTPPPKADTVLQPIPFYYPIYIKRDWPRYDYPKTWWTTTSGDGVTTGTTTSGEYDG